MRSAEKYEDLDKLKTFIEQITSFTFYKELAIAAVEASLMGAVMLIIMVFLINIF